MCVWGQGHPVAEVPLLQDQRTDGRRRGPFPESYSSDSTSRPEPGKIWGAREDREKDRETDRQTDGKSPEKEKKKNTPTFHFGVKGLS